MQGTAPNLIGQFQASPANPSGLTRAREGFEPCKFLEWIAGGHFDVLLPPDAGTDLESLRDPRMLLEG